MFSAIIDPVHRISDEQEDIHLQREDVSLPNEIGLAQVRLRWETIQQPSYGLVGLYRDIRKYVRWKRKIRKGSTGEITKQEPIDLNDGFETVYYEALLRCKRDRLRERRKIRTAYEAEAQEEIQVMGPASINGKSLKLASPFERTSRFLTDSSSGQQSSSRVSMDLGIDERATSKSGRESSPSTNQVASRSALLPTFGDVPSHGADQINSPETPSDTQESVETRANIQASPETFPTVSLHFPQEQQTSHFSSSPSRKDSSSPRQPNTSLLAESVIMGPTLGDAFTGMFDTEKSRARARRRWEKEQKKLEVLERLNRLCTSFDKHMLAPLPNYMLFVEANKRKIQAPPSGTFEEWPEDVKLRHIHPFRHFLMKVTNLFGWDLGLRHQSLTAIAALRNLSRRVHPMMLLLYYPNSVNSFSDAGLLHLLEFEKKKGWDRTAPQTSITETQKRTGLDEDSATVSEHQRREEIKKRLSDIWSARALGNNVAEEARKIRWSTQDVSSSPMLEDDAVANMQPCHLRTLTPSGKQRRRRATDDYPGIRVNSDVGQSAGASKNLLLSDSSKMRNGTTYETPKFGPSDSGRTSGQEEAIQSTDIPLPGHGSHTSSYLAPPGVPGLPSPLTSSPRQDSRTSIDQDIAVNPPSETTSLTESFHSDDDLAEDEFHALLGDIGRPRIWQPRLIMYGGAIQRDRESYGRVSDYIYESPIYQLVVDNPFHPDTLQQNVRTVSSSSSSLDSDEDADINEEKARKEYMALFEDIEEVDLRRASAIDEDEFGRRSPVPPVHRKTVRPTLTEKEGVFQLKIPSGLWLETDTILPQIEKSSSPSLSIPSSEHEKISISEHPNRKLRAGDQEVEFDGSAFVDASAVKLPETPASPSVSVLRKPMAVESAEKAKEDLCGPNQDEGVIKETQTITEEVKSVAPVISARRGSLLESAQKRLEVLVSSTGEQLRSGFESTGQLLIEALQPITDKIHEVGEELETTWGDIFHDIEEEQSLDEETKKKIENKRARRALRKPQRFIFRLNSEMFEFKNKTEEEIVAAQIRRILGPKRTKSVIDVQRPEAATAEDADRIINEALSGVVSLDFRRAQAASGVNVKTDAGVPSSRYGAASVVYRGRIYIFGGAGDQSFKEPVLYDDTWVLSPACSRDHSGSIAIAGDKVSCSVGYIWQEVPLRNHKKPPPCAFHLGSVHDGFFYVYISQCILGEDYLEPGDWLCPAMNQTTLLDQYDKQRMFQNECQRAQALLLKPQVIDAFKKRSKRGISAVNQLWRLDLECQFPEWEELELTVTKGMTHMTRGGIAMNFFGDRLYVYGVVTSSPYVCIGVLDINLRQWLTWVRLPGAPVWATTVVIGKLWIILGMEIWGIFNLETFEWRCSTAPPNSSLRYGCSATWLPPYVPFLPSFEVSTAQLSHAQLTVKEKRAMFNTSLASQYFWLLQQGRRHMDSVHTILLVGGYDKKGGISNQIDQITVFLPSTLATSCFQPPSKDADLLYASLFGLKLGDERVYGKGIVQQRKMIERNARYTLGRQGEKGALVEKLLEEIQRLRTVSEFRFESESRLLQKMDHRFYTRQEELLQQLHTQQDILNQIVQQLKRERRISSQLYSVLRTRFINRSNVEAVEPWFGNEVISES